MLQESIIGTFGASNSAHGTNNEVLKIEVLVVGEYDTLRFIREALSRATLDLGLLETKIAFHYSYEDTPFIVSCNALERPNMIVMDHNFVVQLGRGKIKILVGGWHGKKWGSRVDLTVVTVMQAGHVEDEKLNALKEQWKQSDKITSPFPWLIDVVFLREQLNDLKEIPLYFGVSLTLQERRRAARKHERSSPSSLLCGRAIPNQTLCPSSLLRSQSSSKV
ncbi:unnamed protein product [Prunus armeniaca]|uniref:Uncharacterized protein n=1 Tax=Prunus armeniaca TaxID=36596 RepID=A0A6J5WHG2_PRUAR|nr:unnamed protein product [Prunus armeniaca]